MGERDVEFHAPAVRALYAAVPKPPADYDPRAVADWVCGRALVAWLGGRDMPRAEESER